MTILSNKQILRYAGEKHGIETEKGDWDSMLSLISYVRHIGYADRRQEEKDDRLLDKYNEGYNDGYRDGICDCFDEFD